MIEALLFDFGRVISAPKPDGLFRTYERDLGLAPDSMNRIMFDSPLWQEALVGTLSMAGFWQAIGPQLNLPTAARVEAFRARYYADETINREVVELITALAPTCRLAVVSNHPAGLTEWLTEWGIDGFFETVVCSGEVGVAKPDPAIFAIALDRLGIAATDALFIDDTAGHVRAARALGLIGHHFVSAAKLRSHLRELGVGPFAR